MTAALTAQGSLPPSGRPRDEAWRLSGVENGVEGSSIKRKAFPQRSRALNPCYSKLGHGRSHACFSWLENRPCFRNQMTSCTKSLQNHAGCVAASPHTVCLADSEPVTAE